jgi:sulfotransferase family protein
MPNNRSYAFVFVCQPGELEIGALLLAASLRRSLRCDYDLIAFIPPLLASEVALDVRTLQLLRSLEVTIVPFFDVFDRSGTTAPDPLGLKLPGEANKIVFVASDIIALREFNDHPRFWACQFNAKPADLQPLDGYDENFNQRCIEKGTALPSMRFPATASREYGPASFDLGLIAVDRAIDLGPTWLRSVRERQDPPAQRATGTELSIAVAQLGLTVDCLDEGYNYPVHLKPLDARRPPFFCRYGTPGALLREPLLRELVQSLLKEHPGIADLMEERREWSQIRDAVTFRRATTTGTIPRDEEGYRSRWNIRRQNPPNLIITGIPRSGTSYLCNLLHRYSNCVIVNEPPEIFESLMHEPVPWGVARLYAQIRSDVWTGKSIQNKLQAEEVVEDTAALNERSPYRPQVDDESFVLGTKHTQPYLARLGALRRVLPEARIVVCVRDPFDTISSWKTSFPHLREAKVDRMRVGNPRDSWLTSYQAAALQLIGATTELAPRRAMWWNYMAETILEQGNSVVLVRYHELVTTPGMIVDRILEDFSVGSLRAPIEPSAARSKRSELDAIDEQAIRAICSQAAAELGLVGSAEVTPS